MFLLDGLDLNSFCNMRAVSKKWHQAFLQSARHKDLALVIQSNKAAFVQARRSSRQEARRAVFRQLTGGCFCLFFFFFAVLALMLMMVGGIMVGIGSSPVLASDEWENRSCFLDGRVFFVQQYPCLLGNGNRTIFSVNGGFSAVVNLSGLNLKCPERDSDFIEENPSTVQYLLSRSWWPCVDTEPGSNVRYPPSNSARSGLFILNTNMAANFTYPPNDTVKWVGVAFLGFFGLFCVFSLILGVILLATRTKPL